MWFYNFNLYWKLVVKILFFKDINKKRVPYKDTIMSYIKILDEISKKWIFILCLMCLGFRCTSVKSRQSFEGIITYVTDIKHQESRADDEYFKYINQKYGDTIRIYHSKTGHRKIEYYQSGTYGLVYSTYNQKENRYYTKWKTIDTIYSSSAADNSLQLISRRKGDNMQIMGYKCKSIIIKATDKLSANKDTVTQKLYYAGYPYIDPKLYIDYKDFYNAENYREFRSPYLKGVFDFGPYILSYTAINIKTQVLDSTIFKIDKGIPIKRQ